MRATILAVRLVLTLSGSVADTQIDLRVPAGRSLTATLQGRVSQIRIANPPRVVEFQFGRRAQGTFVAYAKDQPISFDGRFLVRVRYDVEPAFDTTNVRLTWGTGESSSVLIRRSSANRTVFESGEMFFEDPRSCTGLRSCRPSGRLWDEP